MKNQESIIKSLVVVLASICACACAEEVLLVMPKESVKIENYLALSNGDINSTDNKNSDINIKVCLAKDTLFVTEFSEIRKADTSDVVFSDTQEATVETSCTGLYEVANVEYTEYEVEPYSADKRKIILHFSAKYSYDGGEVRDTTLSPWYFQVKPSEVKPQEPQEVKEVIPTFSMEINDKKNEATSFFNVTFKTGEKVDTTFKAASNLIKVGEVKGMDVYTTSTSYVMENMTCDTLSTTTTVVKDHFTVVTEKRVYSWVTNFDSSAGGKVSPKNEVTLTTIKSVTFEYEDYKYTWSFNASVVDVIRRIEEREEEGKVVEGQMRPYLGTYVLKVNTYLYSPQVMNLDGTTAIFSSTAENKLYEVL